MTIAVNHHPLLVILSLLIACAASFTAFDLAGRIRATEGWLRTGWLAAAAIALGGGSWAMHFVAILAMELPAGETTFDPGLTILSGLLALAATGVGFAIVARSGPRGLPLALGAACLGAGLAGVHHLGMAAIRPSIVVSPDLPWLVITIVITLGASAAALRIAFRKTSLRTRLAAAGAMGLALFGMHYISILGSSLTMLSGNVEPGAAGLDHGSLGFGVAGVALVILLLVLAASLLDRRLAESRAQEAERLRLAEAALRDTYRHTPLPLHSLDRNSRILKVSDAWLELLGYRREEVIGRHLGDFLPPSAEGEPVLDIPALVAEGEVRDLDSRILARSGKVLNVLISARAERDASGEMTRALCGLVDVTAHRQAEEALRQAQKMEAVGQLTGGVAHDFNNLLAVVVGNLDRLRRHLANDGEALALAENAAAAAQRGVALTQRMLAFARQQRLAPESVSLPVLVDGMRDLLRQSLGAGVELAIDLAPDLPPVAVDRVQLELALINLAVNGRDAMPDGGRLAISAARRHVAPGRPGDTGADELEPGEYICITVADSGEGMDAATLARARDPFFTTKALGKGTGLGLSMVHGLAEQSGGCLRLASRPGAGSTAEIWLPIAASAPDAEPAAPPSETGFQPARLRVLAVDDDPLVLMNTVMILEDLGHDVIEADSGAAALARLEEDSSVDIVITDQGMPEMTGLQLLAAIRERWPHLPGLVATGYAELPAGVPHVRVAKPFDSRSLAAAIERARSHGGEDLGRVRTG